MNRSPSLFQKKAMHMLRAMNYLNTKFTIYSQMIHDLVH